MSKIFIYYSFSGNGDLVASYLKDKGYEIRRVETKYKLSKKLFFMMMKGGFHAAINKRAKLINFNNDVSSFDEVIIGSPIWNDRLPPASNTVLDKVDLKNKNVTFIFYSGSGECKVAKEKVLSMYPSAKVIILKEPKKHPEEISKLDIKGE